MRTYWLSSKDGRRPVCEKVPGLERDSPPAGPRLSLGRNSYTPVSSRASMHRRPVSGTLSGASVKRTYLNASTHV